MQREPDFFERIPKEYAGLIIAAIGALLLIGAIRRRSWALDMTGRKTAEPFGFLSIMHDLFGEEGVRAGTIIISSVIIVCGLVMFFVMR